MNITFRHMFAATCMINGAIGAIFSFVHIPFYYGAVLSMPISIFVYRAWADIFCKKEKEIEKPPALCSYGGGIILLPSTAGHDPFCRCNGGPFPGIGFGYEASTHSSAHRGYDYQKWVLKVESQDEYMITTWHHMPFIPIEFAICEVHE